jgi:hypothetical protein
MYLCTVGLFNKEEDLIFGILLITGKKTCALILTETGSGNIRRFFHRQIWSPCCQ